ncbi:MAG: tetratricopeptide repeat protein [Candidatus Omnitrophica bacterium]|nr:tetratricopeptide repeat protein [Candidatus Omnitrophota bacterium]
MAQNRRNGLSTVSKNSFRRSLGVIVVLISCLISSEVSSETILFKSGKSITGVIKEKTDKSIILDVGLDVPMTYYLDDVKDILSDKTHKANETDGSGDKQADALEKEGLNLIELGQMQEGLSLLKKAIDLSPQADRHLNLGSVLFGNGVAAFKQGQKDKALRIFQDSQQELEKAISLFDKKTQQMFLGQAYFMLAEMQSQGFGNIHEANKLYEQSLFFYPNPAAERALKQLNQ